MGHWPRTAGIRVLAVVVAAASLLGAGIGAGDDGVAASSPAHRVQSVARTAGLCGDDSPLSLRGTADELLLDRYHLGDQQVAQLPRPPAWTEDPFHDRQWRQKLQQLRYVNALVDTWQATDDPAYRSLAEVLVRSWLAANPYGHAVSPSAWLDQVTAWRTMTLICIADELPDAGWLQAAIVAHGKVLARPSFWVRRGNHALNQSIALLDAGCYLGRPDWQQQAVDQMAILIDQEVDTRGVADEQATGYVRYDYLRFSLAEDLLRACGLPIPPDFDRVDRMPAFLAQATRPDGRLETIGDTDDEPRVSVPGTPLQYAATLGAQGDPPPALVTVYPAGYAFARTGWGTSRPFGQETFLSLQFGPGLKLHGHDDGSSVTLYGASAQLLADPGYGDQNSSTWHKFFVSRAAHNVVTVAGMRSEQDLGTPLLTKSVTGRSVVLTVRIRAYPGISMTRRVIFSRRLGYAVIEDTMSAKTTHTYQQLWHLTEDAAPVTQGRRTWTTRPDGNLLISQLVPGGTTRTVTGATSPIQGWISRSYGEHEPAPVIMRSVRDRTVHLVTLLVPFHQLGATGKPPVDVTSTVDASGFRITIDVDGHAEVVEAAGGEVHITDAP